MTTARASKGSLATLLDSLDLTAAKKEMLRQRWLEQVSWMSNSARRARRRYLLLRIPTVIGGVAIPALITILLGAGIAPSIDWLFNLDTHLIRLFAFWLSVTVAICAGIEEFLRFGERWRHYRRNVELLKTLGWQYLMLSGTFRRFDSHEAAFTLFSERVEDVLNEDVEGYLGLVATGDIERRHDIVV